MQPIALGPFHLLAPIARGGMAEVWRAVHPDQGTPVAVKVIATEVAPEERQLLGFRNEVRAVAGLNHPGIVMVFDYGEVDAKVERATGGRLMAGRPFLAMEFASGGSLSQVRQPLPWPHLSTLLLSLLDALAHAHAHGLTHRDLKPGNVLLCLDEDFRPGIKISDFGIARAVDRYSLSASVDAVIGTAHYMAPEQVEGNWRAQGPWTDLYALGCVAYRMATGRKPFSGRKGFDLLRAQLYEPAPRLQAHYPVPAGFAEWVGKLLEKEARYRYQRAADAAAELVDLGEPPPTSLAWSIPSNLQVALAPNLPLAEAPTQIRPPLDDLPSTTVRGSAPTAILPRLGHLVTRVQDQRREPQPDEVPTVTDTHLPFLAPAAREFPKTWRHELPSPTPMQLRGAGLGLYGLRTIPLVGREPERDAVWRALREVHLNREPRVVVVYGASGTGRTRLVEWIAERADELGAATVLGTTCRQGDAEGAALARMVSRHLRCVKLDREDACDRIARFLESRGEVDEEEVLTLTELVAPAAQGRGDGLPRLESARERHEVITRLLGRLGVERPVVVVLDDVHFNDDAIAFVEHVLQAGARAAPALFLLTVGEEELGERPELAARMSGLGAGHGVRRLSLKPLDVVDRAALVRELLGLEVTLAARVEERTGGNPLFAVQLVGEWAQRGMLQISDSGFILAQPGPVPLPEDVREMWAQRLSRLLDGLPSECLVYLEKAAALGQEVDEEEWQEVCDDPRGEGKARFGGGGRIVLTLRGVRDRARVTDRLFSRRLAEATDRGWAFKHGLFREALEHSAREGGRWEAHHRDCSAVLRRHMDVPGVRERLGRHLVEAGELDAALEHIFHAVSEYSETRAVRTSLGLLGTCEEVMERLDLPMDDPRWGRLWTLRARMVCFHGALEEASAWATRAAEAADAYGWTTVLPEALFEVGRVASNRLELDKAEDAYNLVRMQAAHDGDTEMVGRCLLGLAGIEGRRHRAREALELATAAHEVFESMGMEIWVAASLRLAGLMEQHLGNQTRARSLVLRSVAICERLGSRAGMAAAMNNAAEVARVAGDLDQAERDLLRARELFEAVGDWQAVLTMLNLGLIHLRRGRYRDAQLVIEEARQLLEHQDRRHLLGSAHLALLPCAADDRDWASWDRHLRLARQLLDEVGFAHADNAWPARLAGDLALHAKQPQRALEAYRIARDQYATLGERSEVLQLGELIASLGG